MLDRFVELQRGKHEYIHVQVSHTLLDQERDVEDMIKELKKIARSKKYRVTKVE